MIYRSFSSYLKEIFREKVYRVTVNAGFSCPNRAEGKGCIYCYLGSSYDVERAKLSIEEQIREGMERIRKRYGAKKFLVYFQAYTNTFAPVHALRSIYDEVRKFKDVVGIIIGTRPDCVPDETLNLINSYTEDYLVWVEYGLESSHFKSLRWMRRGHGVSDFVDAVLRTRRFGKINICAHVILGLPTEDFDDMMETADLLSALRVDGVKIHPLHVIRHTELERLYLEERFDLLSLKEYADAVVSFIERLRPETVIQRITGEAPENLLIAPIWCSHREKGKVIEAVRRRFEERKTHQGKMCRF